MRLTAILLTLACIHAAASGGAQTITLNEKAAPLQKVFAQIKKQTGYTFAYTESLLSKAKTVSISIKNGTLEQVLALCFKDQPFTYTIIEKTVVVKPKVNSVIASESEATSMTLNDPPPIDIRGRIINEKGEPVVATVIVKGTNKGITTNDNGEFELKGVDDNATLVISGVSIESFEVKVNGRSALALNAKIKNVQGENVNVVVSTGYQQIPRERATGSFVQIDNELLNRRVSANLLDRLEGVTSGLVFDQRADNPLGISIRGRSTIFANTQPLIVVDNFPYSGDINSINPNDIEAVTILKDAAAASIWGAFSGNGVVVITTKKGKYTQPLKVEINSNVTIGQKPDLYYDKQFINSGNFIDLEKYLFSNGFYDYNITDPSFPVISPVVDVLDQFRSGLISQSDLDLKLNQLKAFDVRKDFEKYFYRQSVNQQYAINLSGGNAKATYFLSGGYDKGISNLKGNESNRINFNSFISFKPVENLEIGSRLVYVQSNGKNNGQSYSPGIYPYMRIADQNGAALPVDRNFRNSFVQNSGITGLLDWQYFPLSELSFADNKSKGFDNRLATDIKYTIVKGLTLSVQYQYLRSASEARQTYSEQSYTARNLINQYSIITGNSVSDRPIPVGAIIINSEGNIVSHSGRGQISFNRSVASHSISAIAGADLLETKSNGIKTGVYGYDSNTGNSTSVNYNQLYTLLPSGNSAFIPDYNQIVPQSLDRFRSYFANGSYTYNNRYTLTASGRLDQSNLFGVKANQKRVPLWSAGFKWTIDKEDFYKIGWLPNLSLRITYGKNGNIDKSVTALPTGRFNVGGVNNEQYVQLISPGNPQLRWEKASMINTGLDFSFKNEVLSGTIEYYHRKGTDLLGDAILPSSTGVTLSRGNYSSMKASGYDVTLNSKIGSKNFIWNPTLLFSYVKDKITKNEGNTGKYPGRPVNSNYSYQWGGLDTLGDPQGYLNKQLTKDYSGIIAATTADPTLFIYSGPQNPTYFGGFRNSFYWKGVSLSANIIFKAGYSFRRNTINYEALFYNNLGHSDYLKRWQAPGDEQKTTIPSLVYIDDPNFSSRNQFYDLSEILITKGDHIRLQDISLSYDITKKVWNRLPFSVLSIYFYANNLGIIWRSNNEGIDPDFRQGIPNPRTLSFGIRANL